MNDHNRVRRAGIGIDRGDKDRGGNRIDRGNTAKRTGSKRCPKSGVDQDLTNTVGAKPFELIGRKRVERDRSGAVIVEAQNHGTESALFTAADFLNGTGTGSGKLHAGIFFIFKKRLTR